MNFSNNDGPLSKIIRYLFPSLDRTRWWWKARSPASAMQTPKDWSTNGGASGAGLKNLTDLSHQDPSDHHHHPSLVVHSCRIISPPPSSLPWPPVSGVYRSLSQSSSYSSQSVDVAGDLIGTESGVHMGMESNERPAATSQHCIDDDDDQGYRRRNQQLIAMRKEYPPPIPLLAQAVGSRMPWTLRRYYVDGRLILREERVRQRDCFEAHRENGRLILKRVPFEDSVSEEGDDLQDLELVNGDEEEEEGSTVEEEEEQEEEEMQPSLNIGFEGQNVNDEVDHWEDKKIKVGKIGTKATFPSSVPKSCLAHCSERCEDPRKCLTFSGIITSSDYKFLPCNANVHRNASAPGSAPLSFFLRRMTAVV